MFKGPAHHDTYTHTCTRTNMSEQALGVFPLAVEDKFSEIQFQKRKVWWDS